MTKKKKTTRKAPAKKAARKKAKPAPRQNGEPKTAFEQGYRCQADVDGSPCGEAPIFFDFEVGEKDWKSAFVCSDHRVSNRLGRLKQPVADAIAV